MSLEGEVALVTGASRGIGQAIARKLAVQKAIVIGTATTERGAQGVTAGLLEQGCQGRGLVLDVTEPESVSRVVKTINDEFGPITVLVNNAGITRDNLVMRMKDEQWDIIIDTNLNSIFRLTKACMRGMIKARRGRVINVASVIGLLGNPGQSNYAAAKAGMIGFAKSLAREVGTRGITINTVAPGFIDTDMTRSLPEAQRKALLSQIPLNRLGKVDDVANAVAFLASAGAAYITGETLNINGGMYMP
ncbi:MAG: 3-oxoacyl-ACP reductase FabG [Gammaproteobacteria bacterium]|nr:3-oxoacyl-ACP reductase FabG [Gammaproteobacteria bacterium]